MDAAFKTAAFPGFTTQKLRERVAGWEVNNAAARAAGLHAGVDIYERMRSEIERREKVAAGDVSVMTPGERLRHARA